METVSRFSTCHWHACSWNRTSVGIWSSWTCHMIFRAIWYGQRARNRALISIQAKRPYFKKSLLNSNKCYIYTIRHRTFQVIRRLICWAEIGPCRTCISIVAVLRTRRKLFWIESSNFVWAAPIWSQLIITKPHLTRYDSLCYLLSLRSDIFICRIYVCICKIQVDHSPLTSRRWPLR